MNFSYEKHRMYWKLKNAICLIDCRWCDFKQFIRRKLGLIITVDDLPAILIDNDFSDIIYALDRRIEREKYILTINNQMTFRKNRIDYLTKIKNALMTLK